jgi:hypothetical protein
MAMGKRKPLTAVYALLIHKAILARQGKANAKQQEEKSGRKNNIPQAFDDGDLLRHVA